MAHQEKIYTKFLTVPLGRLGTVNVLVARNMDILEPHELDENLGADPNYPFKWPDNDPNLIKAQAIAAWTEMMRPREEHPASAYESPLTVTFGNMDSVLNTVIKKSTEDATTPLYKNVDGTVRDVSVKTHEPDKAINSLDISLYIPPSTKSICDKDTDRMDFQAILREHVDPSLQIAHTILYADEQIESGKYEKMLAAFPRKTFKKKPQVSTMQYFLYDDDMKNTAALEKSIKTALQIGSIYITELYKSNKLELPKQGIQLGTTIKQGDPNSYFPVL